MIINTNKPEETPDEIANLDELLPASNWETDEERRVLTEMRDICVSLLTKQKRKRNVTISGMAMSLAEYQRNIDAIDRVLDKHYKGVNS